MAIGISSTPFCQWHPVALGLSSESLLATKRYGQHLVVSVIRSRPVSATGSGACRHDGWGADAAALNAQTAVTLPTMFPYILYNPVRVTETYPTADSLWNVNLRHFSHRRVVFWGADVLRA